MPSTWVATAKPKTYPRLDKDINVDAAIIGGGITGTTAAYLLAKAGAKVVLIDKGRLSESVSAYTTAFISYIVDSRLTDLRDLFGEAAAKSVWESSREAVQMIDQNVRSEDIDCEYMQCTFHKFANNHKERKELAADAELAKKYGFDVETEHDDSIQPKNLGYFAVKKQAKFHPLKYLEALRSKATSAGALIFEGTEAKDISETQPAVINTDGGKVTASKVLVATYAPFNKPRQLFAHKGTYVTYVLELKIPQGAVVEAMYEDARNPYHYLRIDRGRDGYDRAILGGEDHRRELPFDSRKAYAALEQYFRNILPGVGYEIVREWSGPILETIDGLPYIGTYDEKNPNLFVATGFSGSGMTYGTMAGHMFSEFAQARAVPWKEVYDPLRKITLSRFLQKGMDYVEEFFQGYAKNVFKSNLKA